MTMTRSVLMQQPAPAAQQEAPSQPLVKTATAPRIGHSLASFAITPAVTPRLQLNALPRVTPLGGAPVIQRDTACFIPNQNTPYAGTDEAEYLVEPGDAFHDDMKDTIYAANREMAATALNFNAYQKSDYDDAALLRQREVSNRLSEIDHVVPAAKGGCNSFRNACVISKHANASKGDDYPYGGYSGWRVLIDDTIYASANKAEEDDVDVDDAKELRGF